MANIGTLMAYLGIDTSDLKRGQKEFNKSTKKMEGGFDSLKRAAATVFAGFSVAIVTKELFEAQVQSERLNTVFKTVTGSTAAANREMQFIRDTADQLGQNFYTVADTFAQFSAAAKGTAMEGENSRKIFVAMTEAGTALNMSNEQLKGSFKALEQMVSKGNVQAEELRGQLGERLPGAFNLAAEAMGVSTQELNKMLEQGEVLASDLLPRLAVALHEKYGQAAIDASDNAINALNKFQEAYMDLRVAIVEGGAGEVMADGLKSATQALQWLTDSLDNVEVFLISWVSGVKKLWLNVTYAAELSWEGMRAAADISIEGMKKSFGLYIKGVIKGLKTVSFFFDEQIDKLASFTDSWGDVDGAQKRHAATVKRLQAEYKKEAKFIDDVTDELFDQTKAFKEVGQQSGKTSKNVIGDWKEVADEVEETFATMADAIDDTYGDWQDVNDITVEELMGTYDELSEDQKQMLIDMANENDLFFKDWIDGEEWVTGKLEDENKKRKDAIKDYADVASGYIGGLVDAFVAGENMKVAAAQLASDMLIDTSKKWINQAVPLVIEGVINMLAAEVGWGWATAAGTGKDWKEQLSQGALYLVGAGAGILAGKALANNAYAEGGWLGQHPSGGMITQGTGISDDVFLGKTRGNVFNYGMGGEFVVNKNSTNKHIGLLNAINQDRLDFPSIERNGFAGGGMIRGFAEGGAIHSESEIYDMASDFSNSAIMTFISGWATTGSWQQALKDAILYLVLSMGGMIAAKEFGSDILGDLYADGGQIGGNSPKKRGFGWFDDFTDIFTDLDEIGKDLGLDELPTGWNDFDLNDLLEDIPNWMDAGMISNTVHGTNMFLVPFIRDINTPGKHVDPISGIEEQIWTIFEEGIVRTLEDAIDPFGIFDINESGEMPFAKGGLVMGPTRALVGEAGPEAVIPLPADFDPNSLGGLGQENITVNVYVGNEQLDARIEMVSDNLTTNKSRREVDVFQEVT